MKTSAIVCPRDARAARSRFAELIFASALFALVFAPAASFAAGAIGVSAQERPPAPAVAPSEKDEFGFTVGRPVETEPHAKLSPRAQAMREVARLTAEAALAFDRGDATAGRTKARLAVEKLAAIETSEGERGNARGRSKLAAQRGRLLRDYLGDTRGAREAFLDAVAHDASNKAAERELTEVLDREAVVAEQERKSRQAGQR